MQDQAYCTLFVYTNRSDVAFIGQAFECAATKTYLKGTPIHPRRPDGARHERSSWTKSSSLPKKHDLELHIVEILNFLDFRTPFLDRIATDIEEMSLFCFVSIEGGQGSIDLSQPTIQRLAKHNLSITFDLYGSAEE